MSVAEAVKDIPPGRYLVAVSGGVDSMSLLGAIEKAKFGPNFEFVVAHVNHGIRPKKQSDKDSTLVKQISKKYGYEYVAHEAKLGSNSSEEGGRKARRDFFIKQLKTRKLNRVISAHHKDDVIETMIINLIRGTGRKGLSSLKNDDLFLRPLINLPKSKIVDYAKKNELVWNEDETNASTKYLRNYIRHKVVPKLERSKNDAVNNLFGIYKDMLILNKEIDDSLDELVKKFQVQDYKLAKTEFIMLPIEVSLALLHQHLSRQGIEVNSNILVALRNFIHTAKTGKVFEINKNWQVKCDAKNITFIET